MVEEWIVKVNGTPYDWISIDFTETHPSPEPDTFEVTLCGKQNIPWFGAIEIIKGGVTRFYGYIEGKEYIAGEEGQETFIWGRCRKVILWKKYSDRYSDSRLKGFWWGIYPHELLKFLLRCPISDNPEVSLNHKVGWGLSSDSWVCSANVTAVGYYPEWVRVRRTGMMWRGRGDEDILTDYTLNVSAWVPTIDEWTEFGVNPYLNTSATANYIRSIVRYANAQYFDFANFGVDPVTIQSVKIYVKIQGYYLTNATVYIWDGTQWWDVGKVWGESVGNYWLYRSIDITNILNTPAKVNAARVWFKNTSPAVLYGETSPIKICHCYLAIKGSAAGTPADQRVGDYFCVDIGGPVDRVCGTLIESRMNAEAYARNYRIDISEGECGCDEFYDGFETGDFTAWDDNGGGMAVVNTRPHWGTYSARANVAGGVGPAAYVREDVTPTNPLYLDFWVNFDTLQIGADGESFEVADIWDLGTPSQLMRLDIIRVGDDFRWKIAGNHDAGAYSQTDSVYGITADRWIHVQMGIYTDGGAGWAKLWVDGELVLEETDLDNNAQGIADRVFVKIKNTNNSVAIDAYFDDIRVGGCLWIEVVGDVTNNTAKGILHSWTPLQIRSMRIWLVGAANYSWEITQIYIYQSCDADYTVLESSTPCLSTDLTNITTNTTTLDPFNLSYGRLIKQMDEVIGLAHTDYVLWEWWMDKTTGRLFFASSKGGDKSATISFIRGRDIGEAINKSEITATAQRVRVTGRGEGRRQDDVTSDWQTDNDAITLINTFYEKMIGIKTVSDRETSNIYAQIEKEKRKGPVDEQTITVENDPYASGSWEVGDTVTLTDEFTGISGAKRLRKVRIRVDGDGGETITLTGTNAWTDVTDSIVLIMKRLEELTLTGQSVDDWAGEGIKQNKIDPNAIEDVWSITSSNKYFVDVPEEDKNDPNIGTSLLGTSDYSVDKDVFELHAGSGNPAQFDARDVWLKEPALVMSQSARFTCEFEVDTDLGAAWQNGDNAWIGVFRSGVPTRGFGFKLIKDAGVYKLYIYLVETGGITAVRVTPVGGIVVDKKYKIEARCDWDAKYVEYHFGSDDEEYHLVGILPLEDSIEDYAGLRAMYIELYISLTNTTNQAYIIIYNWKTQAKKQGEMS